MGTQTAEQAAFPCSRSQQQNDVIAEAAEALQAGAHDLTVPAEVLLSLLTDPESERAVEKFAQDWQRMKNL